VTGLRALVADFFLAPPAEKPVEAPVAVPRAAQAAGLVAAPQEFDVAVGAVAAAIRKRARSRAVVVCRFGAPPPARAAAMPAARALERRLRERGLDAAAAGTACHVQLDGDAGIASRDAWRVLATAGVPVLIALPGRPAGMDDLLAELDLLVLAVPQQVQPDLADLAAESLRALGPQVATATLPAGALARRLAVLGIVAPRLEPVR
jgi:hypothetical protein